MGLTPEKEVADTGGFLVGPERQREGNAAQVQIEYGIGPIVEVGAKVRDLLRPAGIGTSPKAANARVKQPATVGLPKADLRHSAMGGDVHLLRDAPRGRPDDARLHSCYRHRKSPFLRLKARRSRRANAHGGELGGKS